MNTKQYSSERGQALVLIVLGIVALLGFVALAVDGSMIYSDRRYLQNSADAASLAGAAAAAVTLETNGVNYSNWNCESAEVYAAMTEASNIAIQRAGENGITIDYDISDDNGVTVECGSEIMNGFEERYLDVRTRITLDTETSFAHFVYDGVRRNTVEAIGRIRPFSPFAAGYAIIALNPDDCKGMNTGVEFHGDADTFVYDGGIFSNGCMRGVGNQYVSVTGGTIDYRSEFIDVGSSTFNPGPTQTDLLMNANDFAIDPIDCSAGTTLDGKDLRGNLEAGLYCVDGDATINAGDTLIGNGVTIVMLNGRFHVNGHAIVQLTAPVADPDPSPAIPGLLIYAPPDTNNRDNNKNGILLNGTSDTYFSGTILAAGLDVYITGTGYNEAYHTQVIGLNVQVGGTAETHVTYNSSLLFMKPMLIDLFR